MNSVAWQSRKVCRYCNGKIEHVDRQALAQRESVASAPGTNAIAVGEWVLAVLARVGRIGALMAGEAIGIIGLGHVGRRVAHVLAALGAKVMGYDPLLTVWPQGVTKASLVEIMRLPTISLHAALHGDEPFPSAPLITDVSWPAPKEGQLLLNAGRGGLIERQVLLNAAMRGVTLALDAWPDEPFIDAELLSACRLATPHIAGYSALAKVRATEQLLDALTHSDAQPKRSVATLATAGKHGLKTIGDSDSEVVTRWLIDHYDVASDVVALGWGGRVFGTKTSMR